MKRLILLCGLLAASCGTPGAAYVKADRETYNSVGLDYQRYVIEDATLTQEQKDRRLLAVASWDKRITTAEGR